MYDNNLNYIQYKSITSKNNFNIIVAGAGSGKTGVIINRIGWLINKNNIKKENVCAVTFTNKASLEMKERLGKLLYESIEDVYIGTFHSLSYRILHFYYKIYHKQNHFQIIDDKEQLNIIKNIHHKYKLNHAKYDIKYIQSFINKQKNKGIRSNSVYKFYDKEKKYLYNVYYIYEVFCNQNMLLDFAEILLKSYEILCFNKTFRNIYQEIFLNILVDEFQDTNNIQYAWLKVLTIKSKSISIVCDDDQLIYGWRGADVNNIKLFKKEYKNVSLFFLEQNYRSNSNILSLANAIIKNNKNRLSKKLWSLNHSKHNINIYQAQDDINECKYIIYEIKELKKKKIKLSDICILYRSRYQAKLIEEFLIKSSLPYNIHGKKNFFQKIEIKKIINYLKLILDIKNNNLIFSILSIKNENDKNKIIKIIKILSKKIDKNYLQSIINIYKKNNKNIYLRKYEKYVLGKIKTLKYLDIIFRKDISFSKILKYLIKNIIFPLFLKKKTTFKEKRL